jgi:hypothetical protein
MDALVARNAVGQRFTAPPAGDVVLVTAERIRDAMKQHRANVSAHASLPAYFDDGTALMFLGYFCGGLCGEGNFLLLQRQKEGWRVIKSMMTWIS